MKRRMRIGVAAERGFTLIEILTVIAIISILMVFLVPKGIEAMDQAKVTACQANLQKIYQGLMLFETRQDKNPSLQDFPGTRFFLKIWKYEVFDHTEQTAKTLTCPAVKVSSLTGLQGRKYEEWFDDWDSIDSSYSSYAGRDIKHFGIKSLLNAAKEPLVCDDNEGGMNHRLATNVLMGDGSVKEINLNDLKQSSEVDAKETVLMVGPESPHELLRKFVLD